MSNSSDWRVNAMSKEFLGRGFNFPIRISGDGSFLLAEYEDDIKQAINIIIETAQGERVMRPDFGCGIHDLVFAPISSATISRVEAMVQEALIKYEPRIDVQSVVVSQDEAQDGKFIVNLEYLVRETNNAFNYVYDFYLYEGNA
jgi:phage baseplate assembly protein W